MTECIFCKIASKEAEATIVAENEDFVAFENIKPVAETHILIIPKKHIENFLNSETAEIISDMTDFAQKIINDKNIAGGYKLIFNGGKYQAIPHLHWHLLGGTMKEDHT